MTSSHRAATLAAVIRAWHWHFGKDFAPQKLGEEHLRPYYYFIERLSELDLHDARAARHIAVEQLDGVLAPFRWDPVPAGLWQESEAGREGGLQRPENLRAVALEILNQLERDESATEGGGGFSLPPGWPGEPSDLESARHVVGVRPGEDSRTALRRFFAALDQFAERGVGGRELMVSMNEDVLRDHGYEARTLHAYNPAAFGFQFVNPSEEGDHIVSHVLRGSVEVGGVVLNTGSIPASTEEPLRSET